MQKWDAPHYDFTYFRCGSDQFVTCWIPLSPIPINMGGLTYLENSHVLGKNLESKFNSTLENLQEDENKALRARGMGGKGWLTQDLGALSEMTDRRWLIANYDLGDVVIHSPYIIHGSLSNVDCQQRIRLSADIRYQKVNSPLDSRWDKSWDPEDGL